MELKLIKTDIELREGSTSKFKFYKNMIKKDLELSCWCNKTVKAFGEFQIYSEHQAELNSFDYIISYELNRSLIPSDDSLEFHILSQCSEYFFNMIIYRANELASSDIDELAIKLTTYLLDSIEIVRNNNEVDARFLILNLDKIYFKKDYSINKCN